MIPKDIKKIYETFYYTESEEVKELLKPVIIKINSKYSLNRYSLKENNKVHLTDSTPEKLLEQSSKDDSLYVWDNLLDIEIHF